LTEFKVYTPVLAIPLLLLAVFLAAVPVTGEEEYEGKYAALKIRNNEYWNETIAYNDSQDQYVFSVSELNGISIDVYILDSEEFANYRNNLPFTAEYSSENNATTGTVYWKCTDDDYYYLVVDNRKNSHFTDAYANEDVYVDIYWVNSTDKGEKEDSEDKGCFICCGILIVILVFNGDVISSIDVGRMVESFRETNSMGTIALWEVSDPTRFGLVRLDHDDGNRVKAFVEKPSQDEAASMERPFLVNAGVYVLKKEILDYMEPGVKASIERDVFPFALKEHRLTGFPFTGHWKDAGTRRSYIDSHVNIFRYEFARSHPTQVEMGENCQVHPEAKIVPPVLVGDDCIIENAVVGPCVCLGRGVKISEDVRIAYSVVHEEAKIMRRAVVQDSIMGERSVLNSGALSRRIVGDDEKLDNQ